MLIRQIVNDSTQEDFMKFVFFSNDPDGSGPQDEDDGTWD